MKKQRKLLSQRYPVLYFASVWVRRFCRYYDWYFDSHTYSINRSEDRLPCVGASLKCYIF